MSYLAKIYLYIEKVTQEIGGKSHTSAYLLFFGSFFVLSGFLSDVKKFLMLSGRGNSEREWIWRRKRSLVYCLAGQARTLLPGGLLLFKICHLHRTGKKKKDDQRTGKLALTAVTGFLKGTEGPEDEEVHDEFSTRWRNMFIIYLSTKIFLSSSSQKQTSFLL